MHFFYIDEAGCDGPRLDNPEQPVFVLGGVSVRDGAWNATYEQYTSLIDKYFNGATPVDFELHANQLLSPRGSGAFAGHPLEDRKQLVHDVLAVVADRRHSTHVVAIDKATLADADDAAAQVVGGRVPYLLAFDYMITVANRHVKHQLGRSARGMFVVDVKDQFSQHVRRISRARRFTGARAHRVKWLSEFSFPVDSQQNVMVQLSDLVCFISKKFFEIDAGYRPNYPDDAKEFFARCYSTIHDRRIARTFVPRNGTSFTAYNNALQAALLKPRRQWRRRYGIPAT